MSAPFLSYYRTRMHTTFGYLTCKFLKKTGRESEIPHHIKETKKKYQEMARRFRWESSEWMKRVEREFS